MKNITVSHFICLGLKSSIFDVTKGESLNDVHLTLRRMQDLNSFVTFKVGNRHENQPHVAAIILYPLIEFHQSDFEMKVLASLPLFATANQYYGDKVSF